MELKEEFTTKMHQELSVTTEDEIKLRAGCVWHVWCDVNSSKKEVEECAKMYSISYNDAMRYRDYWLRRFGKAFKKNKK